MPSHDDGRPRLTAKRCLAQARAAAPALAIAAIAFLAWYAMLGGPAMHWRQRGVEASSQTHFRDLVTVLAGARCSTIGHDVLVDNPCDPDGTRMNYPRVWTVVINGTGLGNLSVFWLGMGLATAFFLATVTLMRLAARGGGRTEPFGADSGRMQGAAKRRILEVFKRAATQQTVPKTPERRRGDFHHGLLGGVVSALLWAVALLSPAVTLAVERGNNDLVVFVLVLAATHLLAKTRAGQAVASLLLLLASALKLFPALALPVLFFRRDRYARNLAFLCLAAFAAIVLLTWNDLVAIARATPHSVGLAYGGEVTVAQFLRLSGLAKNRPIYLTPGVRIAAFACSAALPLLGVLLGLLARRKSALVQPDQRLVLPFLAGTFIFVGTFALGSNWDYRLTFLLLALPGTLAAAQGAWGRGWIRGLGALTSGLLVVALWSGGTFPRSWPPLVRAALLRLDALATPMLAVSLVALAMVVARASILVEHDQRGCVR